MLNAAGAAALELGGGGMPVPIGDPAADWTETVACRGPQSQLFFGPNQFEPKRERLEREEAAKELCQQCPAMVACRAYALETSEPFGIWGGLTEGERRAMSIAS